MARYLTDPPLSAQQSIQAQQSKANAEREGKAPIVVVGTEQSRELTRIARDPEARQDFLTREKAERDRLDSERETARVQRAVDALARRTEIVDPTARGMARYAPRTDTPS